MSRQPRKTRKAQYNEPLHKRRKAIASHLAEDLLLKHNRRRVTVIKGDEVKVLRGAHKGTSGKVLDVDTTTRRLTIEGVTHKKADGTDVAMPVHASNVLITRLNLEDKRRAAKLGVEEKKAKKADKPAEKAKPAKAAGTSAADKPAKAPAKQEKPAEVTA